MDYTELRQAIIDYHESDEDSFLDNIDLFIRLSEESLYRGFEFPAVRKSWTNPFDIGQSVVQLPNDYLALYSVGYTLVSGEMKYIYQKDDGYMRAAFPSRAALGNPRYYEVIGERQIEVAPTPAAAWPLEVWYYAIPASIVEEGTTWLGDNCSEALLCECLVRAAIFLKADDSVMKALMSSSKLANSNLSSIALPRVKSEGTRQ